MSRTHRKTQRGWTKSNLPWRHHIDEETHHIYAVVHSWSGAMACKTVLKNIYPGYQVSYVSDGRLDNILAGGLHLEEQNEKKEDK